MHIALCIFVFISSICLSPANALDYYQVYTTTITSSQPICDLDGSRQINERRNLLERLDRSKGTWGKRHPRYRLLDALHGFMSYHDQVASDVSRWRKLYRNVPKSQKKELLERAIQYTQKLNKNEHLLQENKKFQEKIVQHAMEFYEIEQVELDQHIQEAKKEGRNPEKISVGQALKHYVRDWSLEGDAERSDAFPCVLNTLLDLSGPNWTVPAKVLVPGSGVGRLGHDIHNLGGFQVTLNEYSVYMNVAYRYIESLDTPDSAKFHPFIDGWSNHISTSDMQRAVSLPDYPASSSVVLVEGDFTTVFKGQEGTFDYIVTLFFIDTARNLLFYFDTIHKLLKPGGVWVNFGPLLYGSGPFVQLSLDEIARVVEGWGFEFLDGDSSCGPVTLAGRKVRGKKSSYSFNAKSLGINAYNAQHWVARKIS